LINNAKRKYGHYCPPPGAGLVDSTAGGFGAGAASLARGDSSRRCIPCDKEGAWEAGWWVDSEERELWKARKNGDLVDAGAGRGICTGGPGTPRVSWDLALAEQPAIYTSFLRRPPRFGSHPPSAIPDALPNWQWVASTRHLYRVRVGNAAGGGPYNPKPPRRENSRLIPEGANPAALYTYASS